MVINVQISVGNPTPTELWNEMVSAGIKKKVFKYDGGSWPTLQSLIDDEKRLVAFHHNGPDCSVSSSGCHARIPPFFDYVHETNWSFDSKNDLNNYSISCPEFKVQIIFRMNNKLTHICRILSTHLFVLYNFSI